MNRNACLSKSLKETECQSIKQGSNVPILPWQNESHLTLFWKTAKVRMNHTGGVSEKDKKNKKKNQALEVLIRPCNRNEFPI